MGNVGVTRKGIVEPPQHRYGVPLRARTARAMTTVLTMTKSAQRAMPQASETLRQDDRVMTEAPASRKSCREPPSLGPSTSTSYPMLRSTGTALTSTMGAPVISSTWLIIKARLPWAENASSAQMPRS